jgi:protein-S-isoprenylcysteine O-methyltransferase Ste14
MRDDQTTIIVILVAIIVLFLLGGFGMMGFGHMSGGYGISGMCSTIGGIWCYWPSWVGVFYFIMGVLVMISLALLVILLFKRIQKPLKKRS